MNIALEETLRCKLRPNSDIVTIDSL